MKTPVRIGVISMATNIILNIALYKPLGHVGLALATSIAAAVNAILLYRGLRKTNTYQPEKGWFFWNGRLLLASLAMVTTLWLLGEPVSVWQQWSLGQRVLQLVIEIPAAMGAYVFSLLLLGLRVKDLRLTS